MINTEKLENLQPASVWGHFATLCKIPRSSLHEAELRDYLIAWAQARGIGSVVDSAGNLILKKPASHGCEGRAGVILQGHLDMVCQVNAGTIHDFELDPIRTTVRDGWLVAEDTTLGADNGIGVALALAALEEPDLIHPALEVLLTVNEESGMDGARGLAPGTLQGNQLINLDTEEWGHFYLGCAGGVDVEVRHDCTLENYLGGLNSGVQTDYTLVRFDVSGLCGGHSGIDIHLGRGNAIKLLAEALRDLSAHTEIRLIEFSGGSARNAIPREAFALCALPTEAAANIDAWVEHRFQAWQQRFAQVDVGVKFAVKPLDVELSTDIAGPAESNFFAIPNSERDRLLSFIDTVANGVAQMSDAFSGVVDSSDNFGVVHLAQGVFSATFKVRSLNDARADALAGKLVAHANSYGLNAWKDGAYPGWMPNPSSDLLALCQQVYATQFGQPANVQVIHAGLECGLLAASHPQLDMISFGPDIRGAHAPGERVEVASVQHCWSLLKGVLTALAGDD